MSTADSHLYRCCTWLRPARPMAISLLVGVVALLQGCVSNAPSCDGKFEPINLPASAVSAGATEEGTSTESDTDHERR